MNKMYKKQNRIFMCICFGILLLSLLSMVVRFGVRNILMWRMGVSSDNKLVKTVFFDNVAGNGELVEPNIHIWHDQFVVNSMKFDKLIGWETPLSPLDWTRIIKLKNGYLSYIQPKLADEEIDDIADHIADFKSFLDDEDIPFYFMNVGSKVCKTDNQLSEYEAKFEHTNENGDALISGLNKRGVSTIDMRDEMFAAGFDWYKCYYITDHHWTNKTALWAAGRIAEILNEKEGFSFDLTKFKEESYNFTEYDNILLGGQGRIVTLVNVEPEPFTVIEPKFETDLTYDLVSENRLYSGPYKDSILDEEAFNDILNFKGTDYMYLPDAYHSTHINNYPHHRMINNLKSSNPDKKILMLQDSFCWYLTSYLALDVGEVDIIYPTEFEGSIREYIAKTKPDLVILSCNQKQINPIEYDNPKSYFYLN